MLQDRLEGPLRLHVGHLVERWSRGQGERVYIQTRFVTLHYHVIHCSCLDRHQNRRAALKGY